MKSMTGYGRAEVAEADRRFVVEIKSVNHRYLDFNIRMPKKFCFFENAIRNTLKEYIQRGKVDVFITYEDTRQGSQTLQYNEELAGQYLQYLRKMSRDFGLDDDIRVSTLSRYPEVFTMEEAETDEDEIWVVLERAIRQAGQQFAQSRRIEGLSLKQDILGKLEYLDSQVSLVEVRGPVILREYRQKLETKMQELLENIQIDEGRIASEVVLFADKICTDEETVRLRTHIKTMVQVLDSEDSIGRKLDFIAQEMNREANTILSKANDLETSNIAIELKTEIEKIREQIQNIE